MNHPENHDQYKGLTVNAGIEQPASVNPYFKRIPRKTLRPVSDDVEGILKGRLRRYHGSARLYHYQ